MPYLRNVTYPELGELYQHMKRDFPDNERLPYFIMQSSVRHGRLKACYLQEPGGVVCGYALCVLPPHSRYYNIQYIAVLPEHRSKGYGSLFLELLNKRYDGRKVILEVEDPARADSDEDRIMREKRIAFYQRAGLRVLEHMTLTMFGVTMLCMTNDPDPVPEPETLWATCYRMALGNSWMMKFIQAEQILPDLGQREPEKNEYVSEIPTGYYRHFKGGEYRVLCLCRHSETCEVMVVYQALYGDRGIWVRPASMWNEMVEREGMIVPRFLYLGVEKD